MHRRTLGTALSISTTLSVALVTGTVGAGPAEAANPCYRGETDWICQNRYGAPLYDLEKKKTVVSHMYTTTSWFICRTDSGPYVGGPHPYRWVLTQGDTQENGSADGYGYMKDTDIASETDPITDCSRMP